MPTRKNIVIIGSGLGGLVAGNLLVQKGHRVTLFESHSAPGGYTAGFWRKGFYFESGTLSFESAASIFKAMKDLGVLDKVEFVRQRLRILAPGFDVAPESRADLERLLLNGFPAERERLNEFFAAVREMIGVFIPIDKPLPLVCRGWSFYWAVLSYIPLLLKSGKVFKEYGTVTSGEFVGRYFPQGSFLYRFLSGMGYPDMVAWMVGGFLTMFDDYWTVKDGMQSWADALAGQFRSRGGDLRLSCPVERILTERGTAVGVVAKGETIWADVVIAAGDYKKTMLQLLDDQTLIPNDRREKIKAAPVSEGIFTVYLGMNIPNDELRRALKVPHVHFFDDQPGVDVHNENDRQFFEKTAALLYSPSLMNPKLAPEGKSSLMIQSIAPHRWMDNWGGGDRDRYRELKELAKNALIAKAAKVIPDLSSRIEFQDAATPRTYERFTHNTDGATSAWSWNPHKRFYDHMLGSEVKTPVNNLYIGSCWASQVGGVPGALIAAYLCARKIG